MGRRAGLDGCEKFFLHWDSIPTLGKCRFNISLETPAFLIEIFVVKYDYVDGDDNDDNDDANKQTS